MSSQDIEYITIGEMSELAEGARLEIVCAVKSGTEGSNPSLSAKKTSGVQIRKLSLCPILYLHVNIALKPLTK